MELRFAKINPSGNTTVLILDPLPREQYPEVSVKVMADTYLCAEQVGFLEKPDDPLAAGRLHMMGGEFCGNASRGFAAWLALSGPEPFRDEEKEIRIQVSGQAGTLTARVQNRWSNHTCHAEIDMPLPLAIRHGRNDQLSEYSIVVYEGITHVILWSKVAAQVYVNIVEDFLEKEGLATDCFGILFFDSRTSEMTPVVCVKAVDSLVWESSCGSGTAALASALADKQKNSIGHMQIRQPGGDLFASVDWSGGIGGVRLSGDIQITAVGTVYID